MDTQNKPLFDPTWPTWSTTSASMHTLMANEYVCVYVFVCGYENIRVISRQQRLCSCIHIFVCAPICVRVRVCVCASVYLCLTNNSQSQIKLRPESELDSEDTREREEKVPTKKLQNTNAHTNNGEKLNVHLSIVALRGRNCGIRVHLLFSPHLPNFQIIHRHRYPSERHDSSWDYY